MLRCKNKTFNKFLFFSFVFFIISFFVNAVVVSDAAGDPEKIMLKKDSSKDAEQKGLGQYFFIGDDD